jgi:DNA-binding response OmpR family regulator
VRDIGSRGSFRCDRCHGDGTSDYLIKPVAIDELTSVLDRTGERRQFHLVDKGYTDAKVLVRSKLEHGIDIIGPVAQDPGWQARERSGFEKSAFTVDWEKETVTCPAGKQSVFPGCRKPIRHRA